MKVLVANVLRLSDDHLVTRRAHLLRVAIFARELSASIKILPLDGILACIADEARLVECEVAHFHKTVALFEFLPTAFAPSGCTRRFSGRLLSLLCPRDHLLKARWMVDLSVIRLYSLARHLLLALTADRRLSAVPTHDLLPVHEVLTGDWSGACAALETRRMEVQITCRKGLSRDWLLAPSTDWRVLSSCRHLFLQATPTSSRATLHVVRPIDLLTAHLALEAGDVVILTVRGENPIFDQFAARIARRRSFHCHRRHAFLLLSTIPLHQFALLPV
mmetsp:Transcript_26481/g.69610  ORF Transcript_26481/g.69610 Transcript_26481/m.69610 type:complete len:276 (-) Transcript_26481:21-848(-)